MEAPSRSAPKAKKHYMDDEQNNRCWPDDSVEMYGPIETAENRLEGVGAHNRDHGNRH